jgi:hypothetical protein
MRARSAREVAMYGFKDQMMMSWLIGREVTQLGIGQAEVTLTLFPGGALVVPGGWELLGPAGEVVDRRVPHAERTEYRLHHLLGAEIADVQVESETRLVMSFGNGFRLALLDDGAAFDAVMLEAVDKPKIVM